MSSNHSATRRVSHGERSPRSLVSVLLMAAVACLTGPIGIAGELDVFEPRTGVDSPRKSLRKFLDAEALKAFDARREAVAGCKTPEQVAARQAALKAWMWDAIGGRPPATPLKPQTVGVITRQGYRVENIVFESHPGHHVTANVYMPEGTGPFPVVILPQGHSANGKVSGQTAGMSLALHGIAACAYDPIGQGERRQLLENGMPVIKSMTGEHTAVTVGGVLVGRGTFSYRIWDGMRVLDYLATRTDIDITRVGCTGCSGGGTLTSYLMALDERITAAAPSCYITTLEKLFSTIGPQDGEQNIPGQVGFGLEHADYINMRAPRPTLILAATKDFFHIDGTWTAFREAKHTYSLLGLGERVDLFQSDTGHGYPKSQREAMLRFMSRWLLNKDAALVEPTVESLTSKELQCTRTGQVLDDLQGRSVFDLTAERARQLATERPQRDRATLRGEITRLLGLPAATKGATMRSVGELNRGDLRIEKLVFSTETGIELPALRLTRARPPVATPAPSRKVTLYLHGDGKATEAGAEGLLEKRALGGEEIVALDVRGYGELAANPTVPGKPPSLTNEYYEAFVAQHLGRPLLGQRVVDVLSVAKALQPDGKGGPRVSLEGVGAAGPVVLHAAFLDDERIAHTTLRSSLHSWELVATTPVAVHQFSNVVPKALTVYDLPRLLELLGPAVKVVDPRDATGAARQ